LVQRKYLIRIEKSPFSQLRKGKVRLTLLQPATENSKEGNTKQRTKDQETKNKIKHESGMNKSASLTPIWGPINSSMYDSDFSITTFPLTSSAPYSG
jgi:hypothetical protein